MPSSSRRAHTWAGPGRSTPPSAARPGSPGARPHQRIRWRGPRGRRDRGGCAPAPVVGGARLAQQLARPLGRRGLDQLGEGRLDHGFDFGSQSALGEQLQERVCFPRDLQRKLGAGQLRLEPLGAATDLVQLDLLSRTLGLAALGGQAFDGTGVADLAPLGDVGGVETLPAQQRSSSLRTSRQGVVLVEMRALYSAVNERRRGRAARVRLVHRPIMGAPSKMQSSWSSVYVFLSRPVGMVRCSRCLTSA